MPRPRYQRLHCQSEVLGPCGPLRYPDKHTFAARDREDGNGGWRSFAEGKVAAENRIKSDAANSLPRRAGEAREATRPQVPASRDHACGGTPSLQPQNPLEALRPLRETVLGVRRTVSLGVRCQAELDADRLRGMDANTIRNTSPLLEGFGASPLARQGMDPKPPFRSHVTGEPMFMETRIHAGLTAQE